MTTHFRVRHETRYEYSRPMSDGYTTACLLPRDTPRQRVVTAELTVAPDPDERHERRDLFGNRVVRIGMHHPHDAVEVVATSEVAVDPWVVDDDGPPWEVAVDALHRLRGDAARDVRPFAGGGPAVVHHGADLRRLVDLAFEPGRPLVEAAGAFCTAIKTSFEYDPAFTDVSTPLDTVLDARKGVCQDFAHLGVVGLRTLGLAARYVSGYIETSPPPGQPKLVGADASHAWCSVWVPELGWVDFDPTNDQLPPQRHVTVAWGREYGDLPPVRGVVIGPAAEQTLTVGVDVTRLDGDDRRV